MRILFPVFLLLISTFSFGQMLNDSPFNASISNPKYKKQKGPKILIDAGHHNFIVEMGLIKPFVDLSTNDGYQPKIDSGVFTSAYLANYEIVFIPPAMLVLSILPFFLMFPEWALLPLVVLPLSCGPRQRGQLSSAASKGRAAKVSRTKATRIVARMDGGAGRGILPR